MINSRIKIGIVLSLWCCFFASCETERAPCLEPRNIYTRAHFYRLAADTGSATVDTGFANMLFNPLDISKNYTDTGIRTGSIFAFRLSPLADSCRYYIVPDSAQTNKRDTITFFYQRQLQFLSNACGYTYFYNIDSVHATYRTLADTIHSLDSIVILTREVNTDASKEHLKFYFHKQ